jgi:hypothetical protein
VRRIEDSIVNELLSSLLQFVKLFVMIVFIAHFVACAFWFIGSVEYHESGLGWIYFANLVDAEIAEQYIAALYWSFTTMCTVGYGDISPRSTQERLFGIVAILILCFVFANNVRVIGDILTRYNQQAAQYKEKMSYVNQFLFK